MELQRTEIHPNQDLSTSSKSKWLCVMCKTREEGKAGENLQRQGFAVYLPTIPNRGKIQGQVTKTITPMFPGYLFIEADMENQDLSVIRSTLGCITVLRHGARPAIVSGKIMIAVKEAEQYLHGRFEINQGHKPGARYELLEQGFKGHTATFLAPDGRERARILVTLLSAEYEVKVPTSSLGQQIS